MTVAIERPNFSWLTAVLWIGANLAGFGLVGAMFHNFPLAFGLLAGLTQWGRFELMPALLGGLLFGVVPALLVGLGQWLILRRSLALSGWWIVTVSYGMGLQHFLADGFPNARDLSLAVAAASALTALFQARLLKGRVSGSGWWAAAAIGGWWLGWMLSIGLLEALGLWRLAWVPGLDGQQHGLQGLVVGSTYGLLTGMVWLRFGQAVPAFGRMR
jgi:hypothetical protein